jgi:hypothetical protein
MYSLGSQTHHFEHGEQWNLQRKTRVVTKIVIIYKSMHVTKSSMHDRVLNAKLYFKIVKDVRFHICIPQIKNAEFNNNS